MSGSDPAIVEEPDIMGGAPVFKGTRVPIAIVLASVRAGFGLEALREAYPFLTRELLDAARSYVPIQPSSGEPFNLSWRNRILISRERVLPPSRPRKR